MSSVIGADNTSCGRALLLCDDEPPLTIIGTEVCLLFKMDGFADVVVVVVVVVVIVVVKDLQAETTEAPETTMGSAVEEEESDAEVSDVVAELAIVTPMEVGLEEAALEVTTEDRSSTDAISFASEIGVDVTTEVKSKDAILASDFALTGVSNLALSREIGGSTGVAVAAAFTDVVVGNFSAS